MVWGDPLLAHPAGQVIPYLLSEGHRAGQSLQEAQHAQMLAGWSTKPVATTLPGIILQLGQLQGRTRSRAPRLAWFSSHCSALHNLYGFSSR